MMIDEKGRFWLTNEEVEKFRSFFPTPRGKRRVDDKRVLSGIIFVQITGCRWRDAPKVYGPHKTLYTRWRRWGLKGWFIKMLQAMSEENKELAKWNEKLGNAMMDATERRTGLRAAVRAMKERRDVSSVRQKAATTPR